MAQTAEGNSHQEYLHQLLVTAKLKWTDNKK
jgi:hypothetical protein